MKKALQRALSLLGSKTATVWLAGFFILYYLSAAVWSGEAFSSFVGNLSSNNYFRSLYVLFALNLTFRIVLSARGLWPVKAVFFLRLPLYTGLVVFLVSFFMTLNIRESGQALVTDGSEFYIPWENARIRVAGVDSALAKRALREEKSLIFDYEPRVMLVDDSGGRHEIGAFPPKRLRSTFMHILNFGIAPGVELRRGREMLANGYMPLRLTPYGTTDTFELRPFPYKFYLRILPTRVVRKGEETAREYDLTTPRYGIDVVKGDTLIAKTQTDLMLTFDGDMSLRFFPPTDWVLLEFAYDPFLVPLVVGLVLVAAGLALYPLSFQRFRG